MDSDTVITYDPAADYYRLLGVAPTASQEAIQRAYRARAKQVHPDRNPRRRAWAHAQFQQLNAIKDVLLDPARRAEYDCQRTAYLFGLFGEPQMQTRPQRASRPTMSRLEQYRDQMIGAVVLIFLGGLELFVSLVFNVVVIVDRSGHPGTHTLDRLVVDPAPPTSATVVLLSLDCVTFNAAGEDSFGLLYTTDRTAVAIVQISGKRVCSDLRGTSIRFSVEKIDRAQFDTLRQKGLVADDPQAPAYFYLCQPCFEQSRQFTFSERIILIAPLLLGGFAIRYGFRKRRLAKQLL
jgi:hypothetical protein